MHERGRNWFGGDEGVRTTLELPVYILGSPESASDGEEDEKNSHLKYHPIIKENKIVNDEEQRKNKLGP